MAPEDIKPYIIEKLKEGLSVDQIREALVDLGLTEEEIKKTLKDKEIEGLILKNEGVPPPPPAFIGSVEKGDDLPLAEDLGTKTTSTTEENDPDPDIVPPYKEEVDKASNIYPDIEFYVFNCLRQGFSKEMVRKVALNAGWSESDIEEAFRKAS